MHIMTDRGWQPIHVKLSNTPIVEAPPRYRGPLPSVELKAYVKALDAEHFEWQRRRLATSVANVTATVTEDWLRNTP